MKKSLVLFVIFGLFLSGCYPKQKETIDLTFNDVEYVEYGSEFDSQSLVKETNGKIEEYPVLDTNMVGKQTLVFNVALEKQEESFEKEIEVKDTNKPIIELHKDKAAIEYKGKYKISDYIKSIKDEVDGDLRFKEFSIVKAEDTNYYTYQDNVKVDKAGDYKVIITAVDANGNKVIKDIKITVSKEKEVKPTVAAKPTIENSKPPVETPKPSEPNQKDYNYVLTQTIEKTSVSKKVNKIVTFTSTSYSSKRGTAQYFVKENGKWVEKMKTSAIFGSKGMGQGAEGSAKSPIGTYYFEKAYGIKSNPGSRLGYKQINDKHYWCGEQYYNQFIDESVKDHSGCSKEKDEHLIDYKGYYNYIATFRYNSNNTLGKGFGYFMHCKGNAKSTMGCIAIAENQMIYLLKNIDTSTALIIDQVSNIHNH